MESQPPPPRSLTQNFFIVLPNVDAVTDVTAGAQAQFSDIGGNLTAAQLEKEHLQRHRLAVQQMQRQADRLAADALRQIQNHRNEER